MALSQRNFNQEVFNILKYELPDLFYKAFEMDLTEEPETRNKLNTILTLLSERITNVYVNQKLYPLKIGQKVDILWEATEYFHSFRNRIKDKDFEDEGKIRGFSRNRIVVDSFYKDHAEFDLEFTTNQVIPK